MKNFQVKNLILCHLVILSGFLNGFTQKNTSSFSVTNEITRSNTQIFSWEAVDSSLYLYFETPQSILIQTLNKDMKVLQGNILYKKGEFKNIDLKGIYHAESGPQLLIQHKKGGFQLLYLDAKKFPALHVLRKSELLDLEKKEVIETLNVNGRWIVLRADRKKSAIDTYEFKSNGKIEKQSYDFSGIIYDLLWERLYSLLIRDFQLKKSLMRPKINKIVEGQILKMEETSAKKKLYSYGNQIVFTFDHYQDSTVVLMIDTEKKKGKILTVNQAKVSQSKGEKTLSNSVFYQGQLIQGNVSDQELKVKITDLSTTEVLQEFGGSSKEIPFRHSPFLYRIKKPQTIPLPYVNLERLREGEGSFNVVSDFFQDKKYASFGLAINENREDKLELKIGFYQDYGIDLNKGITSNGMDGFSKSFFISLLDKKDFRLIKGALLYNSTVEEVIRFDEEIRHTYRGFYISLLPTRTPGLYSRGNLLKVRPDGSYLYGYIAFDTEEFKLLKFSER